MIIKIYDKNQNLKVIIFTCMTELNTVEMDAMQPPMSDIIVC